MDEKWAMVGGDLSDEQIDRICAKHPEITRVILTDWAQRGSAYVVDPDAVRSTDLRTGESRTLRESFDG